MRKTKSVIMMTIILGLFFVSTIYAQREKEINKTFDKKNEVKIKLVLGSCEITKSSDDKIHVNVVYTYDDDNFEARFRERSRYVSIQEKFNGNEPRGYSRWTVEIPGGTEIDFNSATGDLLLDDTSSDVKGSTGTGDIEFRSAIGEFDVSTGTGNIDIMDSEGEFDVSSGTGRVVIEKSKGNFDASSGTGKVEAFDIFIEYDGEFSSGTGDVEVTRPKGDGFDLSISSGTDDATLDMDDTPIEGYFEFSANARRGRIISPVDFDKEEEYWSGDNRYDRKSFTKGSKTNRFYIKTGTGKARLKR